MPRPKSLSCGGKGPCCHIGYAHRHCEHCDAVISLVTFTWPALNPTWVWPNVGTGRALNGTYNTFGDVGNARLTAAAPAFPNMVFNGNTGAAALPEPTTHLCEVK